MIQGSCGAHGEPSWKSASFELNLQQLEHVAVRVPACTGGRRPVPAPRGIRPAGIRRAAAVHNRPAGVAGNHPAGVADSCPAGAAGNPLAAAGNCRAGGSSPAAGRSRAAADIRRAGVVVESCHLLVRLVADNGTPVRARTARTDAWGEPMTLWHACGVHDHYGVGGATYPPLSLR